MAIYTMDACSLYFWLGDSGFIFNSLFPVKLFMLYCQFLIFLNQLLKKNISGIPFECQTDWILIMPQVLSALIAVHMFANVMSRRH